MNEEAIRDAYEYFYRTGYNGNINQFRDLLNTNKDAVQDAYNYFVETGYNGDINSFKDLIGVDPIKKKETRDTFGPSLDGQYQFKSILGPEFDPDEQEYADYLERKNKEAVLKLKEIKPDLDFPTKEEYYGVGKVPDIKSTTIYEDITDLSAAEKKANDERAKIAQEYAEGKRELTPQQSLVNTLYNSLGRLAGTDDKARYLYGIIANDMKQIGLAEKEIAALDSYGQPVAEFTKDGKNPFMFGAAVVDGLSSVIVSRLQQSVPFVGPYLLASDMIGESIRSFNKEKALANNVTESELYESGSAEVLLPGTIGYFNYLLEKLSLGRIGKAINTMPSGVKKFFGGLLESGITEGATEGGQFIGEELNKFIASKTEIDGKLDLTGIDNKLVEIISSREFRESIYKGIAGGKGAFAGGKAYTAMAGVKTDEQTKKQDDALDKLIKLKDARQKTKLSPEEDQAFTTAEEEAKNEIRVINEEAVDILSKLEEDQVKEIEQLQREQQSLNNQLINTVNSKNLTENQKKLVIEALQKKFKENVDRVNEIKKQVKTKEKVVETKEKPKGFDLTSEEDVSAVEQKYDRTTEADKFTIIDAAKKVQSALQNTFKDLNIVLHDTNESFLAESGASQVGRGAFNRKQNTIHINLQEADRSTLAHEAFHAMLRNTLSRGKWEAETKKMFEAVLPDIKGTTLEKELEDFISNYDTNVQNEERLTQMFARLAETETQFKATTRQKVKDWINKVANSINMNNIFTDKDIQDLEVKRVLNTLAQKVTTGETIEAIEVAKLDSEVREKLIKGEDVEQGSYIGNVTIDKDYKEEDRDIALQLKSRTINIKDIKRGSLNDLKGKKVFGMAADRAAVGIVDINGKEYNMMGGPLYAYLNQGGWAFSAKGPATRVLNNAKETDGIAVIMLQAKEGILGNQMTYDIVVDQFRTAINNGKAKESDLVDDINKSLKSTASVKTFIEKKGIEFVKNINEFNNILREANFNQRKSFFKSLLGGTGLKTKSGFEKKYGFLSTDILINSMTDPAFRDLEYGDLVAAVQFDKNSEIIDTRKTDEYETHPSYPFILKGKPLMVFNKPVDTRNVFGDFVSSKGQVLGKEEKPSGAYTTMQAQPKAKVKTVKEEEADVVLQKKATKVLSGFTKDSKEFIKNLEKEKKKTNVWNAVFDRQSDLKKIFSKGTIGAKEVYNSIVTKAGASAYAKEKFKEAEEKIYNGLSIEDEDTLNAIILAKRIIAINKKRIEKQVEAAKYAKEYGKSIPKSKAKDIDKSVLDFYYELTVIQTEEGDDTVVYKLKDFNPYSAVNKDGGVLDAASATQALKQLQETNPKLYESLDNRSEIYFEEFRGLLKELYDSGRINKGAYEYFRDVNYSPIKVLQQIFKDNQKLTQEEIDKTASLYGIPAKDILALTDKNEMTILTDSRWILAMSTAAVQRKRFNNILMNKIYDTVNLTPIAFEEFITLDRNDAKEKGFVPVSFFRKGEPMNVYMDEQYARQLMDIRVDNKVLDGIEKFSGGKLLKFFATGGNVAFILSNAPIDLMNVALFTDVYNRTPLERFMFGGRYVGLAKVTGDFIKNTTKKIVSDVRGKGEYKKLYEEFLRYGGGMDYLSQTGISKINKGRDTNYDRLLGVLSYLGTTSEQAVRVSVFEKVKKDKIKEYKKRNGVNPTGKSLDNILFEAAAQARETIDFAQGGSLTKQIDKIVPYTNATIQGVRRPIDYLKQNPKGFASALAHVAGIGVAIPGLNFLLAGLAGDDDEEEILKELRENSSKYEKANYYQILNPFDLRDKNGNLNYIRIRKLPTISLFSTPAEDFIYSYYTGKDFDPKLLMQSARATIPFTGGIVDLAGSNPAVSAFIAYYANYDLFRDQEIVRKNSDRPIKAYAEGMEDDDVSVLYKSFATLGASVGVDISPKRMQAAIEKVITSPTTNPLIGLLYGGGEALKQLKDGNADIDFILEPLKGFFDGISRRAYRQTNPNVKKFNEKDAVLELIKENNTESYLRDKRANEKMNEMIKEYGIGNLPKSLPSDFKQYIKENFDPVDHKRIIEKYTRRLKSSVIDGIFFDIAYERDPKNQALYMQYLYGPTMEREEIIELQKFIKTITGRKISKKAFAEYKKMQ